MLAVSLTLSPDGPSSPPRAGTVYSFVRPGDAEAPLQIQLVHNIFKDTAAPTGGGAADTKAFFQDTAVRMYPVFYKFRWSSCPTECPRFSCHSS
jgi:hypothetical protein